MDDDEILTAYHESGHAVTAYALGGDVTSLQLGGETDPWLPQRYGDCRINWGPVDPNLNWQRQREVLAILAGPVAEMIYRNETLDPADYGPWRQDWQHALEISRGLVAGPVQRKQLLEELIHQLHHHIKNEPLWSAIAALADELLVHEFLDAEQIDEVIGFWFRKSG